MSNEGLISPSIKNILAKEYQKSCSVLLVGVTVTGLLQLLGCYSYSAVTLTRLLLNLTRSEPLYIYQQLIFLEGSTVIHTRLEKTSKLLDKSAYVVDQSKWKRSCYLHNYSRQRFVTNRWTYTDNNILLLTNPSRTFH